MHSTIGQADESIEVDKIGTDLLTQFIEVWRGLDDAGDGHAAQIALEPDEVLLKTVPLVRRSDVGMGTLCVMHLVSPPFVLTARLML